MLPPEYNVNRQAIASFAKCAKKLSEGEAMLLVSAFKRLKASDSPPSSLPSPSTCSLAGPD
eukprot:1840124-Amphidinium_carterae.1